MSNFLTQFNDPKRFGIYKMVVKNFEANMNALREMLQNREKPEASRQLDNSKAPFKNFLPIQKNATSIALEKIN